MRFPQAVLRNVARTRKFPSVRSFLVQTCAPQPVFPVPQPVLLAVFPKVKSVLVVVLRLFVDWGVDQFPPPSHDSSNWTLAVPTDGARLGQEDVVEVDLDAADGDRLVRRRVRDGRAAVGREAEVRPLLLRVRRVREGVIVVVALDHGRDRPPATAVERPCPAGRRVVVRHLQVRDGALRRGARGRHVRPEVADAVVGVRAAHRDGLDVDALAGARDRPSLDAEDLREERLDLAVDPDVELTRIVGIDEGDDLDAAHAIRVAVAHRRLLGLRERGPRVDRKVDRAREGGGVRGPLGTQGVRPVPRHVHDDGAQADERQDRGDEDDHDLAARPVVQAGPLDRGHG